jgi:steroid delta-isomerase-like uncharacterized protein
MSNAEIRAFCERFARSWARQDVDALAECYADNCEVISPIFHTLHGRVEVERSLRELFRAFTDFSIEIEEVVISGDYPERVALVWTSKSTHRGEIFGMPGSGRRIDNQVAFFFTLDGGKIVKDRRIYDFTRMLMQLGVLRAKTA